MSWPALPLREWRSRYACASPHEPRARSGHHAEAGLAGTRTQLRRQLATTQQHYQPGDQGADAAAPATRRSSPGAATPPWASQRPDHATESPRAGQPTGTLLPVRADDAGPAGHAVGGAAWRFLFDMGVAGDFVANFTSSRVERDRVGTCRPRKQGDHREIEIGDRIQSSRGGPCCAGRRAPAPLTLAEGHSEEIRDLCVFQYPWPDLTDEVLGSTCTRACDRRKGDPIMVSRQRIARRSARWAVTTDAVRLEAECQRLSEELSELSRRLENLEHEREFLILHTRNLEREMQRLAREKTEAEGRVRAGDDAAGLDRSPSGGRQQPIVAPDVQGAGPVPSGATRPAKASGTVTESPVIPRE